MEEDAVNKRCSEDLDEILRSKLSNKEYEIIKMRFGYYNGRVMTLEEVGEKYHVTRERIRQIEAKAIQKLRRGLTGQTLKTLL